MGVYVIVGRAQVARTIDTQILRHDERWRRYNEQQIYKVVTLERDNKRIAAQQTIDVEIIDTTSNVKQR